MAYFVQFTQADIGVMSRVLAEDLGPTYRAYLAAVNAYDAAFGVGEGSESLIEAQALRRTCSKRSGALFSGYPLRRLPRKEATNVICSKTGNQKET